MPIDVSQWTRVEQTALLTVYARALDHRGRRPILGDAGAAAIVEGIDYDFGALAVPANIICQTALRAKMLDDRVRDFVAEHPDAVVVDLGAGLSTARQRIRPPETVDWYDVDLPRVMAARRELIPAEASSHPVAASLTDDGWIRPIPAGRATMLIADGLTAFVTQAQLASLLRRITGHFGSGEIAVNDYGRVGAVSSAAMRRARRGMFALIGSVWANPGFVDPATPQTWDPRLRLVEEASLTAAPEVTLFPPLVRAATRLARLSGPGRRKARILRYRF